MSGRVPTRTYRRDVSAPKPHRRAVVGSYAAELGIDQLLDVVAEVCRGVNPQSPEAVSQRVYDRALARSRWAGVAPSARATCMRINAAKSDEDTASVTWRGVVEAALKPERDRVQWLVAVTREPVIELSAREVHYAMRRVAAELSAVSFGPNDYTRGSAHINARGRAKRNASTRPLPTANQLITWARAGRRVGPNYWDDVTDVAGLPRFSRDRHQQRGPEPVGLPLAHELAAFAAYNERWPTHRELVMFAKEAGLIRRSHRTDNSRADAKAQAAELLRVAGHVVPDADAVQRGNPAVFVFPVNGLPGAPTRRGVDDAGEATGAETGWTPQRVIAALADFNRVVPLTEGRGEATYRRHLPHHPDWPATSTVIRVVGWAAAIAAARELNASGPTSTNLDVAQEFRLPAPEGLARDVVGLAFVEKAEDLTVVATGGQAEMRAHVDQLRTEVIALNKKPPRQRRQPAPHPVRPRQPRRQVARERRRKSHMTATGRIGLADLLAAGLLHPGDALTGTVGNRTHEATVNADGTITVAGGDTYRSLSTAAVTLVERRTANGWTFWRMPDGRELGELRHHLANA